jgi:hypothetical protein
MNHDYSELADRVDAVNGLIPGVQFGEVSLTIGDSGPRISIHTTWVDVEGARRRASLQQAQAVAAALGAVRAETELFDAHDDATDDFAVVSGATSDGITIKVFGAAE